MKKLSFIALCVLALTFVACEKKQVANPSDLVISFEYREVQDTIVSTNKIEIRSTSTPSYVAPDLWYYFDANQAIRIGDSYQRFYSTGTKNVKVLYKPGVAPDFDAIHASQEFTISITGVTDSIWRAATPVE